MNKYDDPRYEFVEDGIYFDTETDETVFVLDGEAAEALSGLFDVDEIINDLYSDDSDLKEL